MTVADRSSNTPTRLLRDPLDALWRVLCSRITGRILLLLLALLILLGQVIPQLPADVRDDPGALARWTADLPAFYRGQVDWMRATGLLTIYSSIGLRLLLGLTTLALLVSMVEELLKIRQFLQSDDIPTTLEAEGRAEWKLTDVQLADIAANLRHDLLSRRYLVRLREEEKLATLWAIRWPASVPAHLGALVLLLGLVLNSGFGWQARDLALPPEQNQPVGRGDYTVALQYGKRATTTGLESVELLSLFHGDKLLTRRVLPVDRPFRYRNFSVTRQAIGPLITVRGESEDGQPLLLAGHPRMGEAGESLNLAFAHGQTDRYFRSVDSGQVYRVVLADGRLQVDIYRKGETTPALSRELEDGSSATLDGERVTFSLGQYVVLSVRSDPAWGTMLGGGLLALMGIALAFFCRPSEMLWRLRSVRSSVLVERLGLDPYEESSWPALEQTPEE